MQTDKNYIIKAELPGVKKEEAKVSFHDGVLTITAERKEEAVSEGEKRHFSDFIFGRITRSLRVSKSLPLDLDP